MARTARTVYLIKLEVDRDERQDYARLIGILRREWGLEEPEQVVFRALREAAERA